MNLFSVHSLQLEVRSQRICITYETDHYLFFEQLNNSHQKNIWVEFLGMTETLMSSKCEVFFGTENAVSVV